MITGQQLKGICPNLKQDRADALAALMSKSFPKYGITTPARIQAFVAQVAHESGEFTIKTESMNYTTAERICAVWTSRFNLDGSNGKLNAHDYVKNQEKLANCVYSNRMGNGDAASGDGFRYRGGGNMQLTGKESYEKYAKFIGKEVGETADLVRGTDEYALDSACWEFAIDKQLNDEADRGEFITITKRINGGTIGLEERQKYYARAKTMITTIPDNLA
jgi:putative chitinase